MIYPGTGGYSLGNPGGDPNSLEERKRQLIQKLMAGRSQSGLQGHAQPLFGGAARGGSDHPQGALPSLSFNPFLAMAAGRPNEQFQLPNGVTQQALQQAQQGFDPIMGGGAPSDLSAPQNIGGDPQAAGQVFTGAAPVGAPAGGGVAGSPGAAPPDTGAPAAPAGSPAGAPLSPMTFNPAASYLAPVGSTRHLIANGAARPPLSPFFGAPRLGQLAMN